MTFLADTAQQSGFTISPSRRQRTITGAESCLLCFAVSPCSSYLICLIIDSHLAYLRFLEYHLFSIKRISTKRVVSLTLIYRLEEADKLVTCLLLIYSLASASLQMF